MEEGILCPKAIMLIGLPGSGKSTVHRTYDPHYEFHRYSTDDEIELFAISEGKTYGEVFVDYYPEALKIANTKLDDAIERRIDIVFDQTNLTAKKREAMLRKLPGDYSKGGLCLLPPRRECDVNLLKERLDSRPGKVIGWGIIKSMMDTFDMPVVTEGFDELTFYSTFGITPDRVADEGEVTNIHDIFDFFIQAKRIVNGS